MVGVWRRRLGGPDDDHDDAARCRRMMGRRKIEICRIDNDRKRSVTFNKRKLGLIKKASEYVGTAPPPPTCRAACRA